MCQYSAGLTVAVNRITKESDPKHYHCRVHFPSTGTRPPASRSPDPFRILERRPKMTSTSLNNHQTLVPVAAYHRCPTICDKGVGSALGPLLRVKLKGDTPGNLDFPSFVERASPHRLNLHVRRCQFPVRPLMPLFLVSQK